MASSDFSHLQCPLPLSDYPTVLLAHGGGGRLMRDLIEKIFAKAFDDIGLDSDHDSARIDPGSSRLAFTTDAYVVTPLFFPGGDIGTLAVYGTVNDLAMSGARPLYLSAGFILEEGLPMETLWRVAVSMGRAAKAAGVKIVTGDTKVVDRGRGDGIFVTTAGVGVIEHSLDIGPGSIRSGDAVIVNGDVGRHGIAIMAEREGLSFETQIESDCAPLAGSVLNLLENGIEVHCLRDLTRGGLATALVEIARSGPCHIAISEADVPVLEEVRGACELLGFDPMYVANEGRYVAFVPKAQAEKAVAIMGADNPDSPACAIGQVSDRYPGRVTLKSVIGAERFLEMLSGEQLPRIC